MGARLIKISSVYFVIGVLLGMYMSMTENPMLSPVHAHVNLLGWASLALAGWYMPFIQLQQKLLWQSFTFGCIILGSL